MAIVGGVASDVMAPGFWVHQALLASLAGSVIVVMLSVALINEMLERRRRRRWRVLVQYVMFELVRNARMIWFGVLDLAGLLPTRGSQRESVDAGRQVVRDTADLTAVVREIVEDDDRSGSLRSEVAFLAEHADEVLSRGAAVMLGSDVYAEVIDRHVELGGDLAWIAGLFDPTHPPSDLRRKMRARSSPALEIENQLGGEWLADRIVVITQLAEELDRSTLELALRIVPVEWWDGSARQPLTTLRRATLSSRRRAAVGFGIGRLFGGGA
jgi:hypothetical protein